MERFRREISFLLSAGARPGIIPLIDHNLPDRGRGPAWYVMPLAERLEEALGPTPPLDHIVAAAAAFSLTLRDLATDGVHHRDMKPDNLFRLNGEWAIGDFGLVTYPEAEPITPPGRKVGPTDYLAPEMRDRPDTADAELADVYSLAKTLWVLAAGANLPLPGQHRVEDDYSRLTLRWSHRWAPYLDRLIEVSTSHNPSDRPRMGEFYQELNALLNPPNSAPAAQPDLAAVANRIRALGEPHTRRREQIDRMRFEGAKATVRLDEIAKTVFDGALGLLPQFYMNHPVQVVTPRHWSLASGASDVFSHSWGSALLAPPGIGVYATFGYVFKMSDTSGLSQIFLSVQANRTNGGRGDLITILEESMEIKLPSARFDGVAARAQELFQGSVPTVLTVIMEMMEAEIKMHSEDGLRD